jgi:hypothetical protein
MGLHIVNILAPTYIYKYIKKGAPTRSGFCLPRRRARDSEKVLNYFKELGLQLQNGFKLQY